MGFIAAGRPAVAAPPAEERIAVIVGSNLGDAEEEPLRFAEGDAERFRDVMVALGSVRSDRAILLRNQSVEDVLRALHEVRGRAAELSAAGRRVVVFFYYSGHGSDSGLHIKGGRLAVAELRAALATVPAALTLSIVDACRTSGAAKGITRGPAFELVAPEAPRGSVELWASAKGEAAQESEELAGSIFTHFLTSGLRGGADSDRDGRVTLAEIYVYIYRRTLLRTGHGGALQHPSIDARIAGTGEVVMTSPAKAAAFIEVPGGADRYIVFSLPSSSVLGELHGRAPARLALPSGKFLVMRRVGGATSIALADLSLGGTKAFAEGEFIPIAREEFVARGGHIELRPWTVEPKVGPELALRGAEQAAIRGGVMLSRSFGRLVVGLDADYVGGGVETPGFSGRSNAMTGGVDLGYRIFLGPLTLSLSLGLEIRYAWQSLTRSEAERAAQAGFPASHDGDYGAMGPRAGLRLQVPLGSHVAALLGMSAAGLLRRELGSDGAAKLAFHPVMFPSIGAGYAF